MKSSQISSIFTYLSLNQFYRFLLCITTPLLISYFNIVALGAPKEIAQVLTQGTFNRSLLKLGSQGDSVSELQAALKILGFYGGPVDGVYREATASAVSRFKQAAGLSPDGIVDNATWQKLFPATSSVNPGNISVPTEPRKHPRIKRKPESTNNTSRKNTTLENPPSQRTQKSNTQKLNTQKSNTFIQPTPSDKQIPGIQYTEEGWPILRMGMHGAEVAKLQELLQKLGFLTGGVDGDFGATTVTAVKAAQTRYRLEPDGVVGGATWETFRRQLPPKR